MYKFCYKLNISKELLLSCTFDWPKDMKIKPQYFYKLIDIHQRSLNLRHLVPGMGLNLGVLGVFPIMKITVVRQVRMLPACGAI